MRIGIDFDNTLVDYTGVFHLVACELGWITDTVGVSKAQVKQHFIDANKEPRWTELQGLVYGKHINKAKPYEGAKKAIKHLQAAGHEVFIISHKTQFPFIGEKYDLHRAANHWLMDNGFISQSEQSTPGKIAQTHVYFNQHKEDKLAKVAELGCDVFIDDLIDILQHDLYPKTCQGVLFDPHQVHVSFNGKRIEHWLELSSCL